MYNQDNNFNVGAEWLAVGINVVVSVIVVIAVAEASGIPVIFAF